MPLERNLLHYFVSDALAPYSEDYQTIERGNPTLLRLNGTSYSVHVSYVHDLGNTRENPDEDRIQIQRAVIEGQRDRQQEGIGVAFIGFFEGGKTFVAWEPRYVFSQIQRQAVRSTHAGRTLKRLWSIWLLLGR